MASTSCQSSHVEILETVDAPVDGAVLVAAGAIAFMIGAHVRLLMFKLFG